MGLRLKLIELEYGDPYCGYNHLCTEGAEQVFSLLLWIMIIVTLVTIGSRMGSK